MQRRARAPRQPAPGLRRARARYAALAGDLAAQQLDQRAAADRARQGLVLLLRPAGREAAGPPQVVLRPDRGARFLLRAGKALPAARGRVLREREAPAGAGRGAAPPALPREPLPQPLRPYAVGGV